MRFQLRSRLAVCLFVSLACVAASFSPQEQANLDRIASIPLNERQALWSKLAEFDRLPPDERSRIEAIDNKLRAMPPADQERLWTELRHYMIWLQSLPKEQSDALQNADGPESWRKLVFKYHNGQQNQAGGQIDRIDNPRELLGQVHDQFGSFSLLEDIVLIKAWKSLKPEDRDQIAKKTKNDRFALRKALRERDASIDNNVRKSIEDLRTIFRSAIPQETDTRRRIEFRFRKMLERTAEGKKWIDANKNMDKPDRKAFGLQNSIPSSIARYELKVLEATILIESKVPDVSDERLERFYLQELPPWEKAALEDLSPTAARRALQILYRYFYPHPQEIALPKPPANKSKAPSNGVVF